MTDVYLKAMSLVQLALVVQNLPDRPVLWTQFEREARDEYDARVMSARAIGPTNPMLDPPARASHTTNPMWSPPARVEQEDA